MNIIVPHSDRLIQAHRHFTGATKTYWLNELIRYLRGKGLLNNFVLYPMTGGTNYGTGTTVRGIGLLTSNAMTLFNGPTWGADGIGFSSGSSQYGSIPDPLGSETLTVFARITETLPNADTYPFSQFDTGGDQRSIAFRHEGNQPGDPFGMLRSADGTTSNSESYKTTSGPALTDQTAVAQWVDGGGRSLWIDKSLQFLNLAAGSAQTYRLNSTAPFILNGAFVSGVIYGGMDMTAHALALLTVNTDTTVRETITDLINAL